MENQEFQGMESYDLELDKVIQSIKEKKANIIAIQLPDGLKQYAGRITDKIQEATKAQVIIWGGSHYGSCDLAVDVERLGVDLLIAWGHKEWVY